MKKILFTFFTSIILIVTQYCNGQNISNINDSVEDTFTLLTYGLPNGGRQNSEFVIARKWKIRFYAVAGCVVSAKLVDSVNKINSAVYKNIEQKHGKNWIDKFNEEVDEELVKEQNITEILNEANFIKKRNRRMSLRGNRLDYFMKPIDNTDEYNVSVQGWGRLNGRSEWVTYFRMQVNYKTKNTILLSDKIER